MKPLNKVKKLPAIVKRFMVDTSDWVMTAGPWLDEDGKPHEHARGDSKYIAWLENGSGYHFGGFGTSRKQAISELIKNVRRDYKSTLKKVRNNRIFDQELKRLMDRAEDRIKNHLHKKYPTWGF